MGHDDTILTATCACLSKAGHHSSRVHQPVSVAKRILPVWNKGFFATEPATRTRMATCAVRRQCGEACSDISIPGGCSHGGHQLFRSYREVAIDLKNLHPLMSTSS